jgi:hypothetical protein
MNIDNSPLITLGFFIVFSSNVMANDIDIYRWVDENNVVHFSQDQPKNSRYSELNTVSSYQAAKQSPQKKVETPTVDDQLSDFEKNEAAAIAKNKEVADKNCQTAQLNEKTLNTLGAIILTDQSGEAKKLSDKEKKEQLELTKKHISLYCKKDTNKS